MSQLETLVAFDCGPPTSGRTAEKGSSYSVLIPTSLELAKVAFSEQITRISKLGTALGIPLERNKGLGKDLATGPLPILRTGPRQVCESSFAGGIETHHGGHGIVTVFLYQIHVLLWVAIVLVKDESVRFYWNASLHIDLDLGIITLIQKELAIGDLAFPASLGNGISQGAQKVISPLLELRGMQIVSLARGVADDVAIGPPLGDVPFDDFFSPKPSLEIVVI